MVFHGTTKEFVGDIFGNEISVSNVAAVSQSAILCPTNAGCNCLNIDILKRLVRGKEKRYYSIDSIMDSPDEEACGKETEQQEREERVKDFNNHRDNYANENLNALNPSGLPPHELVLKTGAVVILSRNLNTKKNLVNGTRMVIVEMYRNSQKVTECLVQQLFASRRFHYVSTLL